MKDEKPKQDLYRGEEIEKSENLGDMKRAVLDLMVPHLSNFHNKPTGFRDFQSLWNFVGGSDSGKGPSVAIVMFEKENSFVGKEIAISLSKYPSIVLLRYTKQNSLFGKLKLDGWPAAGYIKKDLTS